MYVFGKGKSATTIQTPLTTIPLGQSIVIQGTVLDQSPAQPNTPCVSKESMTGWLEYLHMQKTCPANVKGVPISLDAYDPNGNYIHIGDVTSDGYSGTFGYTWEPEISGQYIVTATFMGDDSYGSSYATAYVSVSEAQATATPGATAFTMPPFETYIVGSTIAIIIVIILVGLLTRRKR